MTTTTPPPEDNTQDPDFDASANLWECARQYVHRREKMSWNINGQEAKPTFLDLFQIHIDGDLGGIGDRDGSRNHGADEAIEIDVLELRGAWSTVQLRKVGELHKYLLEPTDAKERVFLVSNVKSGVVGLLGAQYRLDPEFFSNQLSYMIPDYQRLPSVLKNATYFTFRYARSDEQGNWCRNQLSVSTGVDASGTFNTFLLTTEHGVKVSPCIAYKAFEEPIDDDRDYWSLKEVFEAQITYTPTAAETQTPAYTPIFATVYTAIAVAISEMMFVLATRDKVATQMLNGLNIVQFASTAAIRAEFTGLMRELATGIGQPGIPEGLNLIRDCADLALKQFADSLSVFSKAEHENEKADETIKDLHAVLEYAERVIVKHGLVNERCAQVFGPGGFPVVESPAQDAEQQSGQTGGEVQADERQQDGEPQQGLHRTETAPPPYVAEGVQTSQPEAQ